MMKLKYDSQIKIAIRNKPIRNRRQDKFNNED